MKWTVHITMRDRETMSFDGVADEPGSVDRGLVIERKGQFIWINLDDIRTFVISKEDDQ